MNVIEKNILTKKNIKLRFKNSVRRGEALKFFLEKKLKKNFNGKKY